jgi:tetratricopeptide (TPR) repeat protein
MIRVLAILLVLLLPRFAQADLEADQLTMAGVVEFTNACQTWDAGRLAKAADLFRQACTNASATATNYCWLGTAEFYRALQLLGLPENKANKLAAGAALDRGVVALVQAIKLNGDHAESHALLGTIYGMKISDNVLRAVWLGPRVQHELKLALLTGENNPRVRYLIGTCRFYTAMGSASRREALAELLTAEKLYAAEAKAPASALESRWGRDSCLTFIGFCYESLGQRDMAANYFRKALVLHPQDGLALAGLKRTAKNEKK